MLLGVAQKLRGQFVAPLLQERLLRGFAKLGLGELIVRISRILTAIVLARNLEAAELGLAATAMASYELVRVLANNGIGQMVIRAPDSHLAATCASAYRVSWMLCGAMVNIQLIAGLVLTWMTGRPELFAMSICLALTFLVLPFGLVQWWLLQRDYRLGLQSGINAVQISFDNLLVAVLAVSGFGAWAIVLPKLVVTPMWLVSVRWARQWHRDPAAGRIPTPQVLRFASPVLASEVLVAIRFNLDKMLVGAVLGLEAMGIYYFAFNAGYGLSLVLTSALATASYPYLAEARLSAEQIVARFDQALRQLAIPISVLILLQAIAVFVYVPVLFGQQWASATMVVAILCLSAVTKSWQDLAAQLLRAANMPGTELIASCVFTVAFFAFFALGLQFGLLAGVGVLTVSTACMQLLFASWARGHVCRHHLGAPVSPQTSRAAAMPAEIKG